MKPAIADGHAVTIHYRLTLDDGTVADDSFGGDPLVYLHGSHNIVPGLEKQLTGKNVGETCEVEVDPSEGYGQYDPAADQAVPKSQFPPNVDIQPGMSFQAKGPNGQPIPVWVAKVEEETVTITANHPLAGQRLSFKVEVVDVREATEEEKQHGHVHGPGGTEH
ncbi:MAG: peptidylprolyl isomerase [bacterium]|nr:peptidylprolyl isomerase [bacterium]